MHNQQPSHLASKELSYLRELMNLEALACKKAEHYTQTLSDPALRQMAQSLVNHHKAHFESMRGHLSCC